MIQNKLFRDCLAAIPAEQKAEFDLSFGIAERISEILKAKGLTQKDFARLLNKRDTEISKWLTGSAGKAQCAHDDLYAGAGTVQRGGLGVRVLGQ